MKNNLRKLNVLDLYGDIRPLILSSQIRYNNRVRIKNEDLAQHSYFVAYNVLKVGYDYNIPKHIVQEAIARALVHDIDEMYVSDIPHDCKREYPELRDLVRDIGRKYIEESAPEALNYFNDYSDKNDLANVLVDIGDAISVLQYTNREISLGNTTEDIMIISNEIKARLVKLFDILDEKCKTTNVEKSYEDNFTAEELHTCYVLPYKDKTKDVSLQECLDALYNIPEKYLDPLILKGIISFMRGAQHNIK